MSSKTDSTKFIFTATNTTGHFYVLETFLNLNSLKDKTILESISQTREKYDLEENLDAKKQISKNLMSLEKMGAIQFFHESKINFTIPYHAVSFLEVFHNKEDLLKNSVHKDKIKL